MAKSQYKLRASLFGHEKDVRSVCASLFPNGGIISGSRDVTTRVWVPNDDNTFHEGHAMSGHSNFVSCVTVMPPDEKFPQGLIVTGSHDKTINGYTLDSQQPVFKLEGHSDTVCSLASGKFGSLISGSWDKTAKVWLNQKCVMTLSGHEAAVWAVAIMPEGGFMLTGSADKLIKLWKAGTCQKTFQGHEDCVRGLAILSQAEFLSCANDATIRRWLVTGECAKIYYGHTNYIYSLAILPNGEDFVSTGEDRSLRIWSNGECEQTIPHPTESVWTVCVLENGDIVTGSSDGIVRVFTCETSRMAGPDEQKAYEELLASSSIPAQIGDVETDKLPGKEALFNPGKRDGQTMMIKNEGKIEAHQWNASEGRWVKVGDVVGGSGGSQGSGKQLFEGKEYDYVFSVDLDEGTPGLKLPYNTDEDPYMVAHNWLEKHEISQMYLDQVAKFIMDNVKGVTLGQAAPVASDPFTGGGRYVPSSGSTQSVGGTDPFTGGGRYVPSYGQGAQATGSHGADPFTGSSSYNPVGGGDTKAPANEFFPLRITISFDTANCKAIIGKLQEINSNLDTNHSVGDEEIKCIEDLLDQKEATAKHLELLWKLLQWPPAEVFPVLDVLRLVIRQKRINEHFLNEKDGGSFIAYLTKMLETNSPTANQMLSLRTLTNAFKEKAGEKMLIAQRDLVITNLLNVKESSNKNVQIALASVLLNYAVSYLDNPDAEAKTQCLSSAALILVSLTDSEAQFRLLVCLGTLIWNDRNSQEVAKSLGLQPLAKQLCEVKDPAKVGQCAKFLEQQLR